MNFTHSSRKSWALIRRLGAAQQPPKSTHPSVIANAVAAHLIQVAKAPHDKFERQVRKQGRTLLQQMSDVRCSSSSIHLRGDFSCSAEDETSDSPRLRQHPCGIPEEPGSHSSHLVVQIFLQNHGYTFHPEDLKKGQGDSR